MPSEFEADALPSIAAWCAASDPVLQPMVLDVLQDYWPGVPATVDAILCANMIHIAPRGCCGGLMQGAARHLSALGPTWGLRRWHDVVHQAARAGLMLRERVVMPANNLLLAWVRSGAA